MCGLVGIMGGGSREQNKRMASAIHHRGPDDYGEFIDNKENIFLSMRRLSIIDLKNGSQPFLNKDRSVATFCNGEIYNFIDLRHQLSRLGHKFKTNSDTEVILKSYLQWGHEAWNKLQGMFVIVVVEKRYAKTKVTLVRDRVGIKPVYVLRDNKMLCFASEIKAFLSLPNFSRSVNLRSITKYLQYRYVPGPDTMFDSVKKLAPGTYLEWVDGQISCRKWWKLPYGEKVDPKIDVESSVRLLENSLRKSVQRHDRGRSSRFVFIGEELDSNVILALMSEFSTKPINTFSLSFPEFENEDTRPLKH